MDNKIHKFDMFEEQTKGRGFYHKGVEYIHHSDLPNDESAYFRMSRFQLALFIVGLFTLVVCFVLSWKSTLIGVVAVLTAIYFADLLFNLFLIIRSFAKPPEVQITQEEVDNMNVNYLPIYTVLCPLYKEANVIPQFVNAMHNLDYPKDKLQIMLLLEEDDTSTIDAARRMNLPRNFEIVVVPDSKPKTKPKALNYGITKARGEYIVIYDAEDVPEPDQLKKVLLVFNKSSNRVKCVQAKLNFYNPHQNILTRVFSAEYSLWFDLVLTGLQSINAPIPLGGTSNHFRLADIREVKGWDAFNVTEDADLGMRLVKKGYLTAIVDSTTYEEANSDALNWFAQRTRWIKGYIQTYLVHMRSPSSFSDNSEEPHFITFQLIIGGKVLSMMINPLMWILTISYFAFRATMGPIIESFFPAPVFYMGILCMVCGNFMYFYYYMIGCAKRKYYNLVNYSFLVPFYWLAMSAASYVSMYKLIVEPHYWSKTRHGLHLKNVEPIIQDEKIQQAPIEQVGNFATVELETLSTTKSRKEFGFRKE
ncbi:MAG TPA: glycosyltransferase [Patescibacteria group bacterium]|nr:glycosyltransferase [Patescibacteria group bacterium]